MEDDGIQVNAGAFSVVGNWLGDVAKAGAAAAPTVAVPEAKPGKRGRLGLGAEEPVKRKEETVLEKKVKRKRQRRDMQEQTVEMHGVAGDDLEESRVAAVRSKQPAVLGWSEDRNGDDQLPVKAANGAGEQAASKKRKNKNKKHADVAESKQGSQPAQQQQQQHQGAKKAAAKGKAETKAAEASTDGSSESKAPEGNGNAASEQQGEEGAFKRKRTKKRSRQKNIRKDKRKEEDKPDYLRFGASDYLGRELTDETKKKLGLPVAEQTADA